MDKCNRNDHFNVSNIIFFYEKSSGWGEMPGLVNKENKLWGKYSTERQMSERPSNLDVFSIMLMRQSV